MASGRSDEFRGSAGATARAKVKLPPVGFWSYTRQDDALSDGKLSRLRLLLMAEIQQQYGRERVEIFQDVTTIPHGAQWERETTEALNNSTFLIPIITPNFVQSEWCCREVAIFLEREKQLFSTYPEVARRSRIFPLHLIDVAGIDPFDPEAISAIEARQWFDFRGFRHKKFDEESVQNALSDFAASIRTLLHLKVQEPVAQRRAPPDEAAASRGDSKQAQRESERAEIEARAKLEREIEARRREEEEARAAERRRWEAEMSAERQRLEAKWREAELRSIDRSATTDRQRPSWPGALLAKSDHWRAFAVLVAVMLVAILISLRFVGGGEPQAPVAAAKTVLPPGAAAMKDALAAVSEKDWLTPRDETFFDIESRVFALGTLSDMRALAESGNPRAQHLYGRALQYGQFGSANDPARAIEWHRRSADAGDARGQLELGFLHSRGEGMPKNAGEAVRLYQAAAAQGFAIAQHNLAVLYSDGRGVPKDYARSMALAKQAAGQGEPSSYGHIAYLYQNGFGVPADFPEAVRWARLGADLGDKAAQRRLGVILYDGAQGVAQDRAEGLMWLRKAANAGDEYAKTFLTERNLALK